MMNQIFPKEKKNALENGIFLQQRRVKKRKIIFKYKTKIYTKTCIQLIHDSMTKAMELRDSCEDVDEIAFWDNQVKILNKYLTKSNNKNFVLHLQSIKEHQQQHKK